MADRKDENVRNTRLSFSAEETELLSENPFGGSIELDSVDWGAVARSYKILRLRACDPETFKNNEKLSEDYDRWIAMRVKTIEFDIALRMHFDEAAALQTLLTSEDAKLNPVIAPLVGLDFDKIAAKQ